MKPSSTPFTPVCVYFGDLLDLEVDAIVNPSDRSLSGGGALDGVIHRAGGPELTAACRKLGFCATGQALVTPGFNLRASWVIHTVGPKWRGGNQSEAALLADCYNNSLALAKSLGLRRIAFPAISTGVFAYPQAEAAKIAVHAVRRLDPLDFDEITLVAHDPQTQHLYQRLLDN